MVGTAGLTTAAPALPLPLEDHEIAPLLVESMSEHAIAFLDLRGHIRTWNQGARKTYGYTSEEILGQHFSVLYERRDAQKAKPDDDLRVAVENGRLAEEGWRRRRDGSRFWASVAVTLVSSGDNALGFAHVSRDVSARKAAERQRANIARRERQARREMQRTTQRLRAVQSIMVNVALLDLDGLLETLLERICRALTVDAAAILLIEGEDLVVRAAKGIHELVERRIHVPLGKGFAGRIAAEAQPRITYDLEHEDIYNPILLEKGVKALLGVPLMVAGQVIGVLLVGSLRERDFSKEDIEVLQLVSDRAATALERAKLFNELQRQIANLKATTEELEAFSYSVSHDLRAPLRAMDGFARILVRDFLPELTPKAREYVQFICENSQQMGQLIDDILAFSRMGRRPVRRRWVDVSEIVAQVLDELNASHVGRRVELKIGDLPAASADRTLLKQVYLNLLQNALKYTRPREVAQVEVGCRDEAGTSVYYVKDNGVGFNMRYVDKLFGVFQRLHRAEDYEGVGVGLALVQRIIHKHGGRVWAEGEVDHGAAFYFTLGEERA